MAETTETRTVLTDAPVAAENTVKKIRVGTVDYDVNDAVSRTSITAINTYLGEVTNDIGAINTETSTNTSSITTIKEKVANAYEATYEASNLCLTLTAIGEF